MYSRQKWLIIISFLAIYVVWGSTYLFVAIAVKEIPPFFLAGIRFMTASLIIFTIIQLTGSKQTPTKTEIKNSMIAGFLFLAIGNGGVSWALQFLDSGLTALIISAQPLILLILLWIIDKKPLALQSWIGVALGMIGMYLLFSQRTIVSTDQQLIGVVIVFVCLLSWGLASIFVNRVELPKNYFFNAAIQMSVGGMVLLILGFLFEDYTAVAWTELQPRTYFAEIYLILFGSIVAFTAFNFLLKHVSPEKVATSTYINPIIALALGYFVLNEQITTQSIIAALVLLTGVYFINTKKEIKFRRPFRNRM